MLELLATGLLVVVALVIAGFAASVVYRLTKDRG